MNARTRSGLYYNNKFARITLDALEEVMGRNGLHTILNMAGLGQMIENYPPDNLERQFEFADYSAVNQALEELYGPRGGRGMALRIGRATFKDALRFFGALSGAGELAFKVLPMQTKLRLGLNAMARIFTQVSDQHSTVSETDDAFQYIIHQCPVCYGRQHVDKPVCFIAVGLLQEGLRWVSGGNEFSVHEVRCIAMGDPECVFNIPKTPVS